MSARQARADEYQGIANAGESNISSRSGCARGRRAEALSVSRVRFSPVSLYAAVRSSVPLAAGGARCWEEMLRS